MTHTGGASRHHSVIRRLVVGVVPLVAALWAAQVGALGGSDTTGCYAFSDLVPPLDANAPSFSFVDISSTGTPLALGDDQVSGAIPIGFNFNFYGISYSNVFVSSNGFITFLANQDNGCCQGRPIPRIFEANGFIAGRWTDLYPPDGAVYYQTLGSSPNQQLVI